MPTFNEDDLVGVLQQFGYSAQRIATVARAKRPDVIATAAGETLLVELKIKIDDPKLLTNIKQATQGGGHYKDQRPMGTHRSWGSIVGGAVEQLQADPSAPSAIKLLCAVCDGMDQHDQRDQLHQSLYGIRAITHNSSPQAPAEGLLDIVADRPIATCCYYFAPSLFAQHRAVLCGVMTRVEGKWRLLANSLATQYAEFAATRLYRSFQASNAVIDPIAPKTIDPDDFVIAPRAAGESDRDVLKRLEAKYGLVNPKAWRLDRHRIIGSY